MRMADRKCCGLGQPAVHLSTPRPTTVGRPEITVVVNSNECGPPYFPGMPYLHNGFAENVHPGSNSEAGRN